MANVKLTCPECGKEIEVDAGEVVFPPPPTPPLGDPPHDFPGGSTPAEPEEGGTPPGKV